MSNTFSQALPAVIIQFRSCTDSHRESQRRAIYEANRHRIYSFAFWMTGSEPMAEYVSECTFARAFGISERPSDESIDRALLRELAKEAAVIIGKPKLRCAPVHEVSSIRRSSRREQLELAILELPHTERMIYCMHDGDGYDHARIARTLGITEDESCRGLHEARLRIRELLTSRAQLMAA